MHKIYQIINLKNNMIYIGRTSRDLNVRLCEHIRYSKNTDKNTYLYNSMRKYGYENFKIELLEEVSVEDINSKETEWILKLNTIQPFGLNEHAGSRGGSLCASPQLRKKLSEAKKEYYKINTHFMKNKKLSPERKKEIYQNKLKNNKPKKKRNNSNRIYIYKPKKEIHIINKNTNEHKIINNISNFCKEFNIHKSNMINMINNKKGLKSCGGWVVSKVIIL